MQLARGRLRGQVDVSSDSNSQATFWNGLREVTILFAAEFDQAVSVVVPQQQIPGTSSKLCSSGALSAARRRAVLRDREHRRRRSCRWC